MYCHLSCGKTKHLQNYAVDSFNYIFFKVNNTPEKPAGLFSNWGHSSCRSAGTTKRAAQDQEKKFLQTEISKIV